MHCESFGVRLTVGGAVAHQCSWTVVPFATTASLALSLCNPAHLQLGFREVPSSCADVFQVHFHRLLRIWVLHLREIHHPGRTGRKGSWPVGATQPGELEPSKQQCSSRTCSATCDASSEPVSKCLRWRRTFTATVPSGGSSRDSRACVAAAAAGCSCE